MDYAIEERIGDPALFTGRKEELDHFLTWIDDIKKRNSMSTAILARRKMGKTALMERLFNITFYKNDGVIPFYYEVKERPMWVVDFCKDFFLTFISQYIAFKSRKTDYLHENKLTGFEEARKAAANENLDHLEGMINKVEQAIRDDSEDILWEIVREAPKHIAYNQKEYIVQMIDEFQFLNSTIHWDRKKSHDQVADMLAGGYLSTAESKVAPLLVSGSWVGWLMNLLTLMLPSRFAFFFLKNMPPDEAVEMIFKYSLTFELPVTPETAYLLSEISEGSPFYISSIFRSMLKNKDLTTPKGLIDTLEFETLDNQGHIKYTWMEYVASAFPRINAKNAKNIVLHLSKNKDRELTRKEIMKDLNLEMTDAELEDKLKALVKADIIMQGSSNFRYRGVQDNIFDKVFRGVYEEEIREFDIKDIRKEYDQTTAQIQKKYNRLQGKLNYLKGTFTEYAILVQLQFHAAKKNDLLKSLTRYLPEDFNFCVYDSVWRYDGASVHSRSYNVDVFAHADDPAHYSIIGEIKSREAKKFSRDEAVNFEKKIEVIKKRENLKRAIGFIFSSSGFTTDAETYCKQKGIACSDDEKWLET